MDIPAALKVETVPAGGGAPSSGDAPAPLHFSNGGAKAKRNGASRPSPLVPSGADEEEAIEEGVEEELRRGWRRVRRS